MFFGLDWLTAFVKVSFNIVFAIVVAIPFNMSWNHIATIYLSSYVPTVFLKIPYWDMVAFLLVCTYLGEQIQKLTPKIVSVSQSNTNNNNKDNKDK